MVPKFLGHKDYARLTRWSLVGPFRTKHPRGVTRGPARRFPGKPCAQGPGAVTACIWASGVGAGESLTDFPRLTRLDARRSGSNRIGPSPPPIVPALAVRALSHISHPISVLRR
jgi:hypothetical protein